MRVQLTAAARQRVKDRSPIHARVLLWSGASIHILRWVRCVGPRRYAHRQPAELIRGRVRDHV